MATDNIENVSSSLVREVRPPVTSFEPTIWADTFSNSSFDHQEQQKYVEEIEALKQEARGMLMAATTPLKQMIFIDMLERLGLAYHFETEIQHKLEQIKHDDVLQDCDLFATALGFRLLRQHRHHVSCNVFNKFVNGDGVFEEGDVESLLSLYEAAHVRFHDEEILEEAAIFTNHYLRRVEAQLESPLKEKVKRALECPIHRDVPIVHARIFISIYAKDHSRNEPLLKLAKFNFNYLQNLYREELSQLSRWSKKYDLKSKLPYARDRLAEVHIWCVGCHYEPQYTHLRIGFAKVIQLMGIMDDTYDNYATINEAQLFTEILGRWNKDEVDRLPEYMRIVYGHILSVYEDYECDATQLGKSFAAPYFKEMVQQLGRAYNEELKWIMLREVPSFQDYLNNSQITSCMYVMFAATLPAFKSATQQAIDWINTRPKFAISTSMLGRYWDDLASHQRESRGGQMATRMDLNMALHGVTKQEAPSKLAQLIEEAWKDANREWVATAAAAVPEEIAVQFLNFARLCAATYDMNDGDGYTDPKVAMPNVVALFVDPILIS